jgi:hypothetical protein
VVLLTVSLKIRLTVAHCTVVYLLERVGSIDTFCVFYVSTLIVSGPVGKVISAKYRAITRKWVVVLSINVNPFIPKRFQG